MTDKVTSLVKVKNELLRFTAGCSYCGADSQHVVFYMDKDGKQQTVLLCQACHDKYTVPLEEPTP